VPSALEMVVLQCHGSVLVGTAWLMILSELAVVYPLLIPDSPVSDKLVKVFL